MRQTNAPRARIPGGLSPSAAGITQRCALRRADAYRGRQRPLRSDSDGSGAEEKTKVRRGSSLSRSDGQVPPSSDLGPETYCTDRISQLARLATPGDGTSNRGGAWPPAVVWIP